MCSHNGRRRRRVDDVPESQIRNVRDVDHHSQTVHLAHDTFSKLIEPTRGAGIVAGRTGPTRTHTPRRRHVSHTHIVVALYIFEPVIDRVTTFESHQSRDFAFTRGAPYVGSGSGQHPRLRMLFGEGTYRGDLIVCSLHGARSATAKQLRLHPDREKLRVQPAGLCAYRVKVAVGQLLLNIDVLVKQSLRGIDVHIDRDGFLMD